MYFISNKLIISKKVKPLAEVERTDEEALVPPMGPATGVRPGGAMEGKNKKLQKRRDERDKRNNYESDY